jgi:integrase
MSGYLKENFDKNGKTISFRIGASRGKDTLTGEYGYVFKTVKTDSKRFAIKQLGKLQSEIDRGVYVEPGKLKFGDYLKQWLDGYCEPNLAPDTTSTYRFMCNTHIIPALGNIPLSGLNSQQIQHFETQKLLSGRVDGKGGLSNRSVQYLHITLNKAIRAAMRQHLLVINPMDGVVAPTVKSHEFKTMSEEDINRFLESIKDSEYYPIFFTGLFSGMRRSEVLALRWGDIDLLGMTASVNRTIKVLKGGKITYGQPKTVKSRRLIALTPANSVMLGDHKAKMELERKSFSLPKLTDGDLVFSHLDGNPYLPDSITQVWTVLTKRSGLKGIRLHDARHSHASILLKQGVHPKIVQERLGHATISTTLDIYSHVAPGLQAAAAANFDNIIRPKTERLEKELTEIIQK